MFYTVLYFAVAYFGAGVLFWLVTRRQGQGRDRRRAALACTALLLPWLPYLAVGAQSALFGPGLRPAVRRAFLECGGMCGEAGDTVLTYRVLRITPWDAQVYLVIPCHGLERDEANHLDTTATVINFKRTPHGWQYEGYDTPWSDCGSAEGNVFPPDPQGKSL